MKLIIEVDKEYYEMLKYNVEHGQDYKPFEIIANGIPLNEDICKEFLNKQNLAVIPGETLVALQLACGSRRSRGEWIFNQTHWTCSNCNQSAKTIGYCGTIDFMYEYFKFCPNCGAEMKSFKDCTELHKES